VTIFEVYTSFDSYQKHHPGGKLSWY